MIVVPPLQELFYYLMMQRLTFPFPVRDIGLKAFLLFFQIETEDGWRLNPGTIE
jgi:hypothetical protein